MLAGASITDRLAAGINSKNGHKHPRKGHPELAILRVPVWLHVLPHLKQHLPSLLLPLASLKQIPTTSGLRRNHGHDHHLLLPSNILHLPVHPTLANCLSHRYHDHGNMHYRHLALSGPHVWEIPFVPCFALCVYGLVWPNPCSTCSRS